MVTQKTRLHIADAVGIGVAARSHEMAKTILEGPFFDSQGTGNSRILGGGQTTSTTAAFVNSALIHLLDFDDIHDFARLHPSAVVLPAALAAADLVGAGDKTVVDAVSLGSELMCKLGVQFSPKGDGSGSGWFLTQLFGYFGAALAASIVLGLSREETVNSLGLAYMQAAGGKEAGFGTGSNARSIYPAFAAQCGLQAALLAFSGLTTPTTVLEGDAGFFEIYLDKVPSSYKQKMLCDFGHWHCLQTDMKPWPCCRLSQPYVEVALQAREVLQEYPAANIKISINSSAARLCKPLPGRRCPATIQDAKYSIPFMTAFALVHGMPTLLSLNTGCLGDAKVLRLARKIILDDSLQDNPGHPLAGLTLLDGNQPVMQFRFNPMTLVVDSSRAKIKFSECLEYAGRGEIANISWNLFLKGKITDGLRLASQ